MSLTHKIAHNTLAHAGGRIGGVIIGVATVAVMARYLGQTGFGAFSTISAFVQLAAVFGGLGLYLVTLRMLGDPEKNHTEIFSNILSLRLTSGFILVTTVSLVVWFFPYPQIIKIGIIVFAFTALANALDQIAVAGLQKHLSVGRTALAEITGKSIILGSVALSAYFDLGLLAILTGYVIGSFAHTTINMHRVHAFIPFTFTFHRAHWREIMRVSLPLAVSNIFIILYFKADTIFLSLYRPQQEVGIYGAPYHVLETLISFVPMFMGLVMPILAKHQKNPTEFNRIFQKAFDTLLIIAVCAITFVMSLARPLTLLIAGPEFAASIPVLRILIVATGIIYLAHLTTYAVAALDQQKNMLKYYGVAAFIAVFGYATLIPRYSYWAAAWITVIVELFILISSYMIIRRSIPLLVRWQNTWRTIAAALLTTIVIWPIRAQHILITAPLCILTYALSLHILGVVKLHDIIKLLHPSSNNEG